MSAVECGFSVLLRSIFILLQLCTVRIKKVLQLSVFCGLCGHEFLHVCVPVCIAHCFGALHCFKCFGDLGFQPFPIILLHEKKTNSGIWCREKHKSQVLFYSEW